MAAQADLLKAEIEKTKSDLAGHLAELRVQSQAAGRAAAARAGVALAVITLTFVSFKVIRSLLRHRRP
jgi:hypothetical protein